MFLMCYEVLISQLNKKVTKVKLQAISNGQTVTFPYEITSELLKRAPSFFYKSLSNLITTITSNEKAKNLKLPIELVIKAGAGSYLLNFDNTIMEAIAVSQKVQKLFHRKVTKNRRSLLLHVSSQNVPSPEDALCCMQIDVTPKLLQFYRYWEIC